MIDESGLHPIAAKQFEIAKDSPNACECELWPFPHVRSENCAVLAHSLRRIRKANVMMAVTFALLLAGILLVYVSI